MQVKEQQLEADVEQQTGSKFGQKYKKAVFCHPAYSTYMQNTTCEILDWMNQARIKTAWRNTTNSDSR